MKYIIITYTVTIIIYLLFPTCQELRPTQIERDNILTRFIVSFTVFTVKLLRICAEKGLT